MATIKGSQIRVQLTFSYANDSSINLDTIEYRIEFYCVSRKVFNVPKSAVEKITGTSGASYFCTVDTSVTGPGALKARIYATIPSLPSRTEIECVDTGIIID